MRDDIPLIKKYLDKKEMKKFPNESQIREVKNFLMADFTFYQRN